MRALAAVSGAGVFAGLYLRMAQAHEIYGYTIVATLGYGARSSIHAARDRDGQVYALKRVVRSSAADQRFLDQAIREHQVASQFDQPMLRRSYRLIKHRQLLRVSEVLVVMEMVDGLSLEQQRPKNLLTACDICRQAAEGLGVMHQAGYVHADIKPNNLLMTGNGRIKIIDFGQSCPVGTVKERIQGTPDYIAPEQVRREAITPATDVFNLGASLYWLLTRQHVPTLMPKGEGSLNLQADVTVTPPRELNEQVVPALNALVMDCVKQAPTDRPQKMQTVIDRLDVAMAQLQRQGAAERASSA